MGLTMDKLNHKETECMSQDAGRNAHHMPGQTAPAWALNIEGCGQHTKETFTSWFAVGTKTQSSINCAAVGVFALEWNTVQAEVEFAGDQQAVLAVGHVEAAVA